MKTFNYDFQINVRIGGGAVVLCPNMSRSERVAFIQEFTDITIQMSCAWPSGCQYHLDSGISSRRAFWDVFSGFVIFMFRRAFDRYKNQEHGPKPLGGGRQNGTCRLSCHDDIAAAF